ncbi:MAG: hypothetical protein GXO85_07750 [Chlorobi bacterium]|nr:hypothetical protein [Chlorobiota bacterium]
MRDSTSSFKLRRVTCRGDDYTEVSMSIEKSNGKYEFVSMLGEEHFSDDLYLACIKEGVIDAFKKAEIIGTRAQLFLILELIVLWHLFFSKTKASYTDMSGCDYRYLSITDRGFHDYAKKHQDDGRLQDVQNFISSQDEIYLRIGVSRQWKVSNRDGYWLQVKKFWGH